MLSTLSRSLKEREGSVNKNGKKNRMKGPDKRLKPEAFGKSPRDNGLRQNAATPKRLLLSKKDRGSLLKLRKEEGLS
jgi:hypothetical protein